MKLNPATTGMLLLSRQTIAALDQFGKYRANRIFKRYTRWDHTGGAFGACPFLMLWAHERMPEEISSQYFPNSKSDGKPGVKNTQRNDALRRKISSNLSYHGQVAPS